MTVHAAYPGDGNGSGSVDSTDLNLILASFGSTGEPGFVAWDFDLDGHVSSSDLNACLASFGTACGW